VTAADEPLVSIVSEPAPDAGVELGTLWLAVSRAGGAVGFLRDSPEPEIRAAAEQVIADVRAGRQQMLTIVAGGALAGAICLRRGVGAVVAHRCEVARLMVHPQRQGRGWGRALLAAAVAHAREHGVEQLLLSTRGGTPLPPFYEKLGWTEVGVFPGALRLGPDEVRDEHWFQLRL
jgi:GNAT superfamily N-acetyltransferase